MGYFGAVLILSLASPINGYSPGLLVSTLVPLGEPRHDANSWRRRQLH
ncbi:hypothetical protein [Caudoviricetes sp.]|nr:hypothetical protein [Caudoviricetes sp.]